MTDKQLKYLQVLLRQAGEDASNAAALASGGRTVSIHSLTPEEVQAMFTRLQATTSGRAAAAANKMRRKIISHMYTLGWLNEKGKPDLKRLDAWCMKYSPHHKPLNDHTEKELPALVSQFGQVLNSQLKQ